MTHSLIIELQLQLAVFQHLLEQMQAHAEREASRDEALALVARIRKQREAKKRLLTKTHLISGMRDKPVISIN